MSVANVTPSADLHLLPGSTVTVTIVSPITPAGTGSPVIGLGPCFIFTDLSHDPDPEARGTSLSLVVASITDATGATLTPNTPPKHLGCQRGALQATLLALCATGPAARSPFRQVGPQRCITPGLGSAIGVNSDLYAVISAVSFSTRTDMITSPGGYHTVQDALNQHLAAHPDVASTLQIVAVYETAQAA